MTREKKERKREKEARVFPLLFFFLPMNELKVDLNVQDVDGETALHDAARFGHKGVATLLVDGGADASLQNKKGQTALQVAEEYDQPDIIAILSGKK